jgi:hypothetical protein
MDPISKKPKIRVGGGGLMVEWLKVEALGSNPIPAKKKINFVLRLRLPGPYTTPSPMLTTSALSAALCGTVS